MNRSELTDVILSKKSFLCVGLDSDIERMPYQPSKLDDTVYRFNREIIKATRDHCIAYKINTAFYEARGTAGWKSLEKTINCIPDSHFIIMDAKRGDIGNTSEQYAKAFYDQLGGDALTVVPYMGRDSVQPFYRDGKWVIILALTSNAGAKDFQLQRLKDNTCLYERVIDTCASWGTAENTMFVTGATRPSYLERIRQKLPEHFFLVPGVGKQGGDLEEVCEYAMNEEVGLIVNVSRSIIYASKGPDFAHSAQEVAEGMHNKMSKILDQSFKG